MEQTERAWGYYKVIEEGKNFKIKELVVYPNRCLSYQMHRHRNEFWLVKEGSGSIIIGDKVHMASVGKTYMIREREWHQIINGTNNNFVIHEIQYGHKCEEEDIERYHHDGK